MEIAFTIPAWLLWAAGIVAGLTVLVLAVMGGLFVWVMRDFRLF